jgi:hypothetical protein
MVPQYFDNYVKQIIPTYDPSSPTFAGISGLTAEANGSLKVIFSLAAGLNPPLTYRTFIKEGSATGLFDAANLAEVLAASPGYIFNLPNGTLLQKNHTYYVGVRAVNGLGIVETNSVSLSAASQGVLDENALTMATALNTAVDDLQTTEGLLSADVVTMGAKITEITNTKDDLVALGVVLTGVVDDLQQAIIDLGAGLVLDLAPINDKLNEIMGTGFSTTTDCLVALKTHLVNMEGAGFVTLADSLKALSDKLGAGGITAELNEILDQLNEIMGSGFVEAMDSLKAINDDSDNRLDALKADTEALLSTAEGI